MFKLSQHQIGHWGLITLENEQSGNKMTVAPSRGACLTHLSLKRSSILDGYHSSEELEELPSTKSGLLFPFPNRLRDGKYQWEKANLQFPINEPERGNAIHGLGLKMPFKVQHVELLPDRAAIVLSTDYKGSKAYPFPFRKEVRYEVEGNVFRVFWKVINRGPTTMPFAWGWHPYFRLGGTVDDWKLRLPPSKQVLVDDRMIPNGQMRDYNRFEYLNQVGNLVFDTCFELPDHDKVVELEGPAGRLQMIMGKAHSYFQVFTPPSRMSIALEPMTSNINSFQNENGLLSIPGDDFIEDACELLFRK